MIIEIPIYETIMLYLTVDVVNNKILSTEIKELCDVHIDFRLTSTVYSYLHNMPSYVNLVNIYKAGGTVDINDANIKDIENTVEVFLYENYFL